MKVQFVDEYEKNVDSKYEICLAVAKRARELGDYLSAQRNMERVNIIKPLVDIDSLDPLEIAFQELKEEKIAFEIKKEEEK
ncbi:MAG: DNA-directed RNA polymerase subunit omega [Actinobacteria bacterium]|nr:DNA-directed RNA polymerase subunit omega [Actinomycetota bacterium]